MKKLLLALVIPVMILGAGCNQNSQEIASLKATNDSLLSIGIVKDSMVVDFVNAFNEIQANLDSIKMKEKIISKSTEEVPIQALVYLNFVLLSISSFQLKQSV